MNKISKVLEKWIQLYWSPRSDQMKVFICAMGFLFLSLIFYFLERKDAPSVTKEGSLTPPSENIESADTYIPKNHVLIPIEIANHESLAALLGAYGVVDLFAVHESGSSFSPGKKVASRVKMIRAPLNPQKFAVLTHETQAHQIVNHSGPFFVVIQNPEVSAEAEFTKPEKKFHRPPELEIEYQNNDQ